MNKKAVLLLSGGLDSATCLHWAQAEGYQVYALSVRYGQRHDFELRAASRLAEAPFVKQHLILDLNLRPIGGSSLLDDTIPTPKDGVAEGIPVTYVPARNTVLLSLALGWAETLEAQNLIIGVNAVDFSGYPDCRPAFIKAFEQTANAGTRAGVSGQPFRVLAPLIQLSKAEIIRLGLKLDVNYGWTHTCYDPDESGHACGQCDACRLRLAGFAEAGAIDPGLYQSHVRTQP